MNQELDRYFHHVYRNTHASFIPDTIPEFKSKAEIDAWFHELERKDVLYAEYVKNLAELERKEQEAIDNLVHSTIDTLIETTLDENKVVETTSNDIPSDEIVLEDGLLPQ